MYTLKDQLNSISSFNPTAKAVDSKKQVWNVPFRYNSNSTPAILIIQITRGFPRTAPTMKTNPPVRHQFVRPDGVVVCPTLQKWEPATLLGSFTAWIISQLANATPLTAVRGRSPYSAQPVQQTRPAPGAPRAAPGGAAPGGTAQGIAHAVAQLPLETLQALLTPDADAELDKIFQTLPPVQELKVKTTSLQDELVRLAGVNAQMRQPIVELEAENAALRAQLEEYRDVLHQAHEAKAAGDMNPQAFQAELQAEASRLDAETKEFGRQLLVSSQGKVTQKVTRAYVSERTEYHKARAAAAHFMQHAPQ